MTGNRERAIRSARGVVFGLGFLWALSADAADFDKDIRPVLEKKCLGCHNPNTAKGDVSLAEASTVFAEGATLVVPGKALESDLYLVSTPEQPGGKPAMPEKGEPLTEDEVELLREWIDAGAKWPEGLVLREASKADKTWWAYQPLGETEKDSIDAYLDEKLTERGLEMNSPADRRTLIRRVTYDLTGLPPTPEEVAAFIRECAEEDLRIAKTESAAPSIPPQAYGRLVDRLLASPHYGERWGRHWLDVVRFGESIGYERNVIINTLWPFRDYVIRSINEDKPFDQLIREHLAGDVFGKDQPDVEIGSAFLVAGPYDDVGNQDKAQAAQIRANTLDEIINATGEAFLGMTLGCARCHDHKFDPILQSDYYALYATFSGVRHGERVLATEDARRDREDRLGPLNQRKSDLEKRLKEIDSAILERAVENPTNYEKQWIRPKVDRAGTEERFEAVTAKFVRLVSEAQDIKPEVRTFAIDEFEVWSAGAEPKNIALAANGGRATGAARAIEDFAGAYGPQLAIDGQTGARFLSAGAELTIELAAPARIDRVVFSSARDEETPEHPKFVFVADYRIEVSDDGKVWREVASGWNREPVNSQHREMRLRRAETSPRDADQIAALRHDLAAVDREIQAIPALPTVWLGTRNPADAKGPFHVFIGGSPQRPGDTVAPASLSTLSEVAPGYTLPADAEESERRLDLANWITQPENPLTPRVLANRLWQYHFGTGIVDTPNDFGYMGGRPTHPELLDFLAVKLVESGWRLKPMHRLIVMSRAYQQSSAWREDGSKADGDSRLLWRFPPRRLSAEEIRDTILSVSGRLDRTMGGPGFRLYRFMQDNVCTYEPLDTHGPETHRRAVYHQNARASVVDLMTDFDQPDCAFSTPKRVETTTPLQALTMLNHQFTLDMAAALAGRVAAEVGETPADQAALAFSLAFQRNPDPEEIGRSVAAIKSGGLRAFCRALLNSSELIYLD